MADIVSRIYGGFRGVDFRGEEIHLSRSPDALNVWKDYKETESIRTRPGLTSVQAYGAPVYGVFFFREDMLVHSGAQLYRIRNGTSTLLYSGLREAASAGFMYKDVWYFKDGKHYLRYDGDELSVVEGYVPTTSIGRKPTGGGTTHEDINMLTGLRQNSFLADGGSFDFYLDARNIDTDYVPVVTVDGVMQPSSAYTVDYAAGKVSFVSAAPDAPLTDGQDNVVIRFKKTIEGYKESILGCTLLQVFDNRVFFSGNREHPNVVWHCSLDDPSYCSDLDYYQEGLDTAQINGIVAGNNALWVFRAPSQANTTVFYHTPTIDDEYGKIYPSTHSSVTIGCTGKAINFADDIIFFSDRGMEGISGDVTTEQAVAHRSSLVDRKLTAEPGYRDMVLEEWEGYLLVFIGKRVYLADSRTAFQNENHIEYEWFYWELEKAVTSSCVKDGILYLGTEDGVYTLTDAEAAVNSHWVTPKDKFKHPHKLKTTNKRGCVAEATGDVSVYAKLEDTPFEHIGTYHGVTDAFVSRIKRKKFKDIQLKFASSTRFSLETVTLECFIGGYVKRVSSVQADSGGTGSNVAAVITSYLLPDNDTGDVYRLYLASGNVILAPAEEDEAAQEIILTDRADGVRYMLHVSAGDLHKEETESVGADVIPLTDVDTGEYYILYIEGSEVHWEVVQ